MFRKRHNIPITKLVPPIEVSLEPLYKNLFAALTKFKTLSTKMIKFYASKHIDIKEAKEPREFKGYDFSTETTDIGNNIKLVKEHKVKDGKGGIIEPAKKTIYLLDSYCEKVDGYMNVDNSIMIQIFDLILRNKLTLADIKEYEIFYKSVYLDLCEAVRKFYINVIKAIGEDAYIPMTKNMFGEDLHVEKASGETVTGNRIIDKTKFESKVVRQQSFDKDFKEEMEKFISEQK